MKDPDILLSQMKGVHINIQFYLAFGSIDLRMADILDGTGDSHVT